MLHFHRTHTQVLFQISPSFFSFQILTLPRDGSWRGRPSVAADGPDVQEGFDALSPVAAGLAAPKHVGGCIPPFCTIHERAMVLHRDSRHPSLLTCRLSGGLSGSLGQLTSFFPRLLTQCPRTPIGMPPCKRRTRATCRHFFACQLCRADEPQLACA